MDINQRKALKLDKEKYISNLKHNFVFAISACAFFTTFIRFKIAALLGVMFACIFSIIIAAVCSPMKPFIKAQPLWIKILSLLSTVGMVFNVGNELLIQFENSLAANGSARTAVNMLGWSDATMRQIVAIVGYCAQFVACVSIFIGFVAFWNFLTKTCNELNCKRIIARRDLVVAGIFFCIEMVAVIVVYSQGNDVQIASVYSSDGHLLFEPSAFINIVHGENDLRQPLFGAFAAPFTAPLYVIGLAFNKVTWIMPILLIIVQFILVLCASFLIADSVCGESIERTILLALLMASYPPLFNGFLIEQYMIAYWYLALLTYAITKQKANAFLFASAVGTLSPGACIVPFMSSNNLFDDTKEWMADIFKCCISFVCIVLCLGRGDVIFSVFSKATWLLDSFGSGKVSFVERLLQYFNFVKTCLFTTTNALVVEDRWELTMVDSLSIIGIAIFCIAVVGFVISRKQKISQISFVWVLLSFILCAVIGWGSTENIMPLYSLYFFWAFVVLVFQLVRCVFEHIKLSSLRYILYTLLIVSIYVNNIINMKQFVEYLLNFSGRV